MTLAVAIGSLVFVGVLSVLVLGLTSAQRNTFALLEARANDTISNLQLRVRHQWPSRAVANDGAVLH